MVKSNTLQGLNRKTHCVGDVYILDGEKWVLCYLQRMVALVCIDEDSEFFGESYSEPVLVRYIHKITPEEFMFIGSNNFKNIGQSKRNFNALKELGFWQVDGIEQVACAQLKA